jgi:phosphopantetheine binding protein
VLKLDRVGIIDNFFDLGGHSYLVTETLGWIATQFHVNLSIVDFLANPRVTDLLKRKEEVRQEGGLPIRKSTWFRLWLHTPRVC